MQPNLQFWRPNTSPSSKRALHDEPQSNAPSLWIGTRNMSSWLCHPQGRDTAPAAQQETWEAAQLHQQVLDLITAQKPQVGSSAQKRPWVLLLRELQGCTSEQCWMLNINPNRPTKKKKKSTFPEMFELLFPCTPHDHWVILFLLIFQGKCKRDATFFIYHALTVCLVLSRA